MVRAWTLRRLQGLRAEPVATATVIAGALVFTLLQLHPQLLFLDSTPTGGDGGAHVYGPAYLRDHLLPSGRLTGWAPGWFAGIPLYQFYPVVPALLIVALNVVLPYGIAFKLVTISGIVALPLAAYCAGRLAALRFPAPAVLAVATVPFLFDQSFSIWGGNIQSTLAGEFAFSIALSLGVLSMGLMCRALRTGEGRAATAAALGLTFVCHPIVAFYVAVATVTIVICHLDRRRLRDALLICAVAGALAAFWVLPFLAQRTYMSSMGFIPLPDPGVSVLHYLAPARLWWALALAAVGLAAAIVQRQRLGLALAMNAGLFALMLPVFPASLGLWNARLLPFYFLCVYLLAGLGVVAIFRLIAAGLERFDSEFGRGSLIGTPVAMLTFVVIAVGLPLHVLPGGRMQGDTYSWLGLTTKSTSVIPGWSRLNLAGYERQRAWPEYHAVMTTMGDIGRRVGCGRAHWEYDASLSRYGTPLAMMLLPYWTHGCIDSMEGLYFESSDTTPYHFLTAAEVSAHPSNPMTHLPYGTFDLAAGIAHMQLQGVRYYMAFSQQAVRAARRSPRLRPLAVSGPWHVYELMDNSLVAPLTHRPAVVEHVGGAWTHWRDATVPWFKRYPSQPDQPPLTDAGPPSWQRVQPGDRPRASPLAPVTISNVHSGDFDISFDVDRPGVPVLVKTSYFPNWSASGADGPFRAAPNLMVVVPTSRSVHLHYGHAAVDGVAYAGTLVGLLGLVLLRRRRALRYEVALLGERTDVRWPLRRPPTTDSSAAAADR